jgi:hypothetical protein
MVFNATFSNVSTTKQIMANKTLHSIIFETINSVYLKVKEKLEDIKGVNGRRTQYNGIVWSVLLRLAASDYTFGIYKLCFTMYSKSNEWFYCHLCTDYPSGAPEFG